jgi:hypothetical protein
MPAYDPQQRVFADREDQPPRQALPWPTTKGDADVMNNTLEPRCPARKGSRDIPVQSFREYPLAASRLPAAESTRHDPDLNTTPPVRR